MTPQSIDLTGLPGPVADEIRKLVATLRDNLASAPNLQPMLAGELVGHLAAQVETEIRKLESIEGKLAATAGHQLVPTGETPDHWAARLQAWVDTHPARSVSVDDSRESLYADRGE